MPTLLRFLLSAWVLTVAGTALAEEKPDLRFIELAVNGSDYQGRKWCSDNELCWLLGRDGRLHQLALSEIQAYRQLGPVFRPYSTYEMKALLLEEFGKQFEVEASGMHMVIAPKGHARSCLTVVESTTKSFQAFYIRRNIKLDRIEAPLVTIVFPTQKEFLFYCKQDQLQRTNGLRGYYHPTTNRVALYLEAPKVASGAAAKSAPPSGVAASGGFRDTLSHETTHQLGFNQGLHSRFGDDPVWVIEGMAMLFEGNANRDDQKGTTTALQRINRERFVWFLDYRATRRKANSLEDFVVSDHLFIDKTLDAYAEAWALTFFLAETRPGQLSTYLKKLANRTESGSYTPLRRLADFKACFGRDITVLENQYLKFLHDIEKDAGNLAQVRIAPPTQR